MADVTILNRRLLDGGGASEEHADHLLDKVDEMIGRVNTINSTSAAANGTGVTLTATPGQEKLVVTFVNTPIPLVDEAAVVAYGSLKIIDLPAGYINFQGSSTDLAVTKSSAGVNADWDGDFALGTAAASNNATLTGTEQDLIPSTATPQAVAGVTTADGASTATEVGAVFDGSSTAKDVYLNFLVDDADHDVTTTPCNLILNGTLTFVYANIGDN